MRQRIHPRYFTFAAVLALSLSVLTLSASPAAAQSATHAAMARHAFAAAVDIVRDPADVPSGVGNRPAATVKVELTAQEVVGKLDPASGTSYRYWTFNGKVPGPMIRVRQNDTVEVTLHNRGSSQMVHSIDFHAAIGPGGGAAMSQALPGQTKTFTFRATTPGLYVYHCGTPMIADHIANGMYGLILVEPPGGLPHVDHEYYVMQAEVYTASPKGKAGLQTFSEARLLQESPEYFVFNGAVDALSKQHPMHADAGQTVRIFFGDAGPNETSSLHMVGEIFSRDYQLGSLTSPPLTGVQTATIPPGGAAILELTAATAGQFNIMDHAMARMAKGLMATLEVTGSESAALMHSGPATPAASETVVSGTTAADWVGAPTAELAGTTESVPTENSRAETTTSAAMSGMVMDRSADASMSSSPEALNGCLTLQNDGKVLLKLLHSNKTYRLEAQPLLFEENNNHLVHVTGHSGSVVPDEDPHVPSFVVDSVNQLASSCSANISAAALRKASEHSTGEQSGTTVTVGMGDMSFKPAQIVINAGQEVVWKNTSTVVHNVIDNGKALNKADVERPAQAPAFGSAYLQPGQAFAHKFTVPGVYRYVCTLHEGNGMKGVVIVRAPGAATLARADSTQH
jgi:copper-containing nitrite reductase